MRDKLIKLLEETGMIEGTSRCNIVADELLANGVIVPPCKVGQTVWVIDNFRTFTKPILESRTVLSVQYYKSGAIQYHYKDGSFYKEHIGRTVFSTKEEAEQALKGGAENG